MPSTLHIIATPIGNRSDITLRAVDMLRKLDTLFAEDTRELRKLLDLTGVSAENKKIHSLSSHNMKSAIDSALHVLAEGKDIGFVSDRGTPGISDPGSLLVKRAIEGGFMVRPVPGPSAVTALVSASYLVDREFVFIGFLPESAGERSAVFSKLGAYNWPFVFYESPKRIRKAILAVRACFPSAEIHAAREITKAFEEHRFVKVGEENELSEQGEYSVLVRPNNEPTAEEAASASEKALAERLLSDRDWSKEIASRTGASPREIYNALMAQRRAMTR